MAPYGLPVPLDNVEMNDDALLERLRRYGMAQQAFRYSLIVFASAMCLFSTSALGAGPTGAKSIFDSGEGPTVRMSVNNTPTSPAAQSLPQQKYVGISYELLLLTDDGQIKKVTNNRAFSSGERIIMKVMTNRSGNLKIFNIGPTGNTNLLFDDVVDAYTMTQVPKGSNFRFVGSPGTETLLIMLSDSQMPPDVNPQVNAGATPPSAGARGSSPPGSNEPSQVAGLAKTKPAAPPPSPSAETSVPPLPAPPDSGSLPPLPPPPNAIASNIESAKGIKGSKDIVMEDRMQSSFAVVSPRNTWRPVKSGTKDIVVESNNGTNYGVIPASALAEGGILSLTVKLKHK